jgi:hypothetical protein
MPNLPKSEGEPIDDHPLPREVLHVPAFTGGDNVHHERSMAVKSRPP